MHRVFVGCKGTVTLFSDQLNSPWRSEGAHMDATDSIGDFCLRLNESDQRRVQVHERLGQAACLPPSAAADPAVGTQSRERNRR